MSLAMGLRGPLEWAMTLDQTALLFDRSLYENIRYGTNVGPEQVESLIVDMGLDTVFRKLPDGLRSPCGHQGRLLSGGQRQS